MNMDRNRVLDTLKGICIVFVIISHFRWSDAERTGYYFPFWIDMAVPLFMIISGWTNSASYAKKVSSFSDAYSYKLVIPRLIKYTVPYAIILIFELCIEVLMKKNDSLLQILRSILSGGWGAGSYYYPILVQMIFFCPVIYFIVKRYNQGG